MFDSKSTKRSGNATPAQCDSNRSFLMSCEMILTGKIAIYNVE